MRRKKEQNMLFFSVHAKSFKTLQKLSFLLTYITQLIRRLNCLIGVATDLRQLHVFINCLNISFMRVFKEMMKNIDKK